VSIRPIIDRDALRHEIDKMTPDVREIGPLDTTEQATVYAAMVVHGMALFMARDDFPWSIFADEPKSRHDTAAVLEELRDELLDEL